jgi:alanyl-tRNA synthetase
VPLPTEKLFLRDSLFTRFEARLLGVARFADQPSLMLDRTAFYAEAGGQLGDRGTLTLAGRTLAVVDVQVDDAGVIHHLLAKDTPAEQLAGIASAAPAAEVAGTIDVARRRDHMSQHTGQHMLSAALADLGAETVSSRLGSEASTIDVGVATLDEARLADAEARVNAIVLEDRPVIVHFPTADALAAMPLRRPPKVTTDVRVVEVEGLDFSPCGGTHCARTGQVGPVRVTGTERYKGGLRVSFLAGQRALADARAKESILRGLARDFTCGVAALPDAIARLRADLDARTQRLSAAKQELIELLVASLHAAHPAGDDPTRVVVVRERDDQAGLRALAAGLARRDDVIAFVGTRDEATGDWLVAVERGKGVTGFDAGKWLKSAAARHQGRGGGRPERAEGRLGGAVELRAAAHEDA